jgi:phage tail sheath protein FI
VHVPVEYERLVMEAAGAFVSGGGYPSYFVKCDAETNPQGDDARGTLHMLVGFAAVEPGDYLVFRVSQTVESARVVPVSIDRFRFVDP